MVGKRTVEINGEAFEVLLIAGHEHIATDGTVSYDIELRFKQEDAARLEAALNNKE